MIYRHHPSVVATELAGEVVALQLDTGRYYTLNESAACAWEALTSDADREAVVDALARHFDVQSTEARAHVDVLLEKLLRWRLIESCG